MEKLDNLIEGVEEIKKIGKIKSDKYDYMNVKKGTEESYFKEGWEIFKEMKQFTKLKREKPMDRFFEDKCWGIFSKLGFEEMNYDRNFRIPISNNNKVNSKQIDLFARDENVILVAECKSSKDIGKKSLRNEINEIGGYRVELLKSLKRFYGRDFKISFLLMTKNIMISDSDAELANTYNITIIDESKLDYYNAITKQIGTAAKYQLLAEIFEGMDIDGLNEIVPAIKSKVNNKVYYSFMIEPARLLPIAYVAHKLRTPGEGGNYQRIIQKKKLNLIREYIKEGGGVFPNSIILNFKTKNNQPLRFDPIPNQKDYSNAKFGHLYLPPKYKSAWIIDGQHRLYGFVDTEESEKITIPVIAFENLSASEQAKYFVDINSKQTNVKKDLLQELYSTLLWESDNEEERLLALTSRLCAQLGEDYDSPLYGKLKASNISEDSDSFLTLTSLTDAIKKSKLIGDALPRNNKLILKPLSSTQEPFMDETLKRSKRILKGYFNYFKNEIPENWNLTPKEGGYLCTNNGLTALILTLTEILNFQQRQSSIDLFMISESKLLEEYIYPMISPVLLFFKNASYDVYKNFKAQQGAAGQRRCSYEMMNEIHKVYSDFNPPGLEKHLEDNDEEKTKEIKLILHDLEKLIHRDVIQTLKAHLYDDWWSRGIPKHVRIKIREIQEEKELENIEEAFNLIHYDRVIYQNWEIFENNYSIFEDKHTGSKKKALDWWFNKLNEIRNKTMHPQRGNVTKEEYDFVMKINSILRERLKEIEYNAIVN